MHTLHLHNSSFAQPKDDERDLSIEAKKLTAASTEQQLQVFCRHGGTILTTMIRRISFSCSII